MVEKKKALNKTSESKNVDPSAELKGLKAFTKTSIEEKVCFLLACMWIVGYKCAWMSMPWTASELFNP